MSASQVSLRSDAIQYESILPFQLQQAYIDKSSKFDQALHLVRKKSGPLYVQIKFTAQGVYFVGQCAATGAARFGAIGFALGVAGSAVIKVASRFFPALQAADWGYYLIKYVTLGGAAFGAIAEGAVAGIDYTFAIRNEYCNELSKSQKEIYNTVWGQKAYLVSEAVCNYFKNDESLKRYICPITDNLMIIPAYMDDPETFLSETGRRAGLVNHYEYEAIAKYLDNQREIAVSKLADDLHRETETLAVQQIVQRVENLQNSRYVCPLRVQKLKKEELKIDFELLKDQAFAVNKLINEFVKSAYSNRPRPGLKELAQRLKVIEKLQEEPQTEQSVLTLREVELVKKALLPVFSVLQKRNDEHSNFLIIQLVERLQRGEITQQQYNAEVPKLRDFYYAAKIDLSKLESSNSGQHDFL